MPKVKVPETPKERLELAKRYLENAKSELKNSPIDRKAGIYTDVKYVSGASGKAYLAALEALKALFLWEGLLVDMYDQYLSKVSRLSKDKDVLKALFNEVYKILHLGGYYRELQNKKAIDAGFESVEKIIRIVEKHINGQH